MLDPVFFFFDHLIQTKMLPRKMASETFFAKFTEYCEKEGYPTPKDLRGFEVVEFIGFSKKRMQEINSSGFRKRQKI